MGEKGEVKQTRRKKKKPQREDPNTALVAGADAKDSKRFVCGDKSHFIQQRPKQICQRCGRKGHHIKECTSKVEFFGAMVELREVEHQAF